MKTTKTQITGYLKSPKLLISLLAVFWFVIGSYAFNGPIGGCTPGSCTLPLVQDVANQQVGIGTVSPNVTLDVVGGVRIGQLTTVNINLITCDANTLGTLIFDTDEDAVKVCNSGGWALLE